jgi:hypothetical protein
VTEKRFDDPDQYLGHLGYQLAHSDSYMMGPLAQLKKVNREKLDVAARLTSGHIEYNFNLLQDMGTNDATVQIKGLVFNQALLHMERKKMLTGGLQQYEPFADLASELSVWHKLEHDRWKVSDNFPKPSHFGLQEGLSMEEYFKLLVDQAKKKGVDPNQLQPDQGQGGGQSQGGGGGGQDDEEGDEQQGQGQGEEDEQDQKEGQGSGPSGAQNLAKALGSNQQYHKQDNSQWHQISKVQQEAAQATLPDKLEQWMKQRGTEPSGLKRLIEEIRKTTKEKWYDRLKYLVGNRLTTNKYRYSIKRPSRRLGIPNAGRIHIRKGILAAAIDTSGSVSQTELEIYLSKLHQMARAYEMPFEVIICDADIHVTKMIKNKKDVDTLDLRGGGGTSSKPVFEYLEGKRVDLLVYLTDLEIDFPEEPRYKVIWGVINKHRHNDPELVAPFGETHHLATDETED